MNDRELDIALKHVGEAAGEAAKYKNDFLTMCDYYYSLFEGDTHLVDDAIELMRKHGLVDENGERIYDEDE